jgi:hypothetical protein
MPYKIDVNEEVKSDKKRSKKFKKIETEGNGEFIAEIIQDEMYIDDIIKQEEKKSVSEEEERTIFDIVKIKDVYHNSKILNIEMTSYNSNNLNSNVITTNGDDQNNNIYNNNNHILKEKKKINIEIDPLGYSNSKRKKDGITFFGFEKDEEKKKELDILIYPIENEVLDDKYYGKHFQIKFNPYDMQYYLKDLGHGFGTFIKIMDWLEIKNNFLLNIGENYLVFSIGYDNDVNENFITRNDNIENDNLLNVKIFSSNSKQNFLVFTPSDSPFTIGRKAENAINIEDNMLSRIHCTIKFKDQKWFIIDGNINNSQEKEEGKKSTNGSWVYAYEDSLLKDKMTFKCAHYLFDCNLTDIRNKNNSSSIKNE